MKRSKFIFGLAALFIVVFIASLAGAEGFTFISKEQLKAELKNPNMTVIDVRTPYDWNSSRWKIQGAIRESPADVGSWMGKYPKDKEIALYCA